MFSASEIFDIAIKLEQNGERLYRDALTYVSDEELKKSLHWLADQEKRHQERFKEMKGSVGDDAKDRWAEELSTALLEGAVEHHAFSLEEVDFHAIRSESDLLKVAIEFEQDGVMFYEIMGAFITDALTLSQVAEIINEERRHIQFFEERQQAILQIEPLR